MRYINAEDQTNVKALQFQDGCSASAKFAPITYGSSDPILLLSEYATEYCPGHSNDLKLSSTSGALNERVYIDSNNRPDTVTSHDGRYLVTFARGDNEHFGDVYGIYVNNPRIQLIELAKPIPEFCLSASSMVMTAGIAAAVGSVGATARKLGYKQ